MTNPATEADPQTRTIRGVVTEVKQLGVSGSVYRTGLWDEESWTLWTVPLDHPLVVGQTYEVEVTVREVE